MRSWQLQEAKARFSELVRHCGRDGPQDITVRGEPAAVLLSRRDYERLRKGSKPRFVDFIRRSPLRGLDLRLDRTSSPARDIEL